MTDVNLGELEFQQEDFNELARVVQGDPGDGRIARECAANIVNQELRERLAKAPLVHATRWDGGESGWYRGKGPRQPKTVIVLHGRLVCIKEIK